MIDNKNDKMKNNIIPSDKSVSKVRLVSDKGTYFRSN